MDKTKRIARNIANSFLSSTGSSRTATDSYVPDWEKKDPFWNEYEEWYYQAIDKLFSKVNGNLKGLDLPFEFSIEYDEQFETCREDMDEDLGNAIGIAVWSNQVDAHVLPVAIDVEKVYIEFTAPLGGTIAKPQAENEIEITLWHEVAHGIIGMFEQQFQYNVMKKNKWTDEEQIAEEFGQAKGDLNGSKLGKWIAKNAKDGWKKIYG